MLCGDAQSGVGLDAMMIEPTSDPEGCFRVIQGIFLQGDDAKTDIRPRLIRRQRGGLLVILLGKRIVAHRVITIPKFLQDFKMLR